MNTRVAVTAGQLIVEPHGLDRLWSFTHRIEIPLDQVRGATYDPEAADEPKGVRAPGLGLPGKYAGTFHKDGERHFWNVSPGSRVVVISLQGHRFDRLYLTVADPRALVDRINRVAAG